MFYKIAHTSWNDLFSNARRYQMKLSRIPKCAKPQITGDEIFKFHPIRFERVIWKHFYANFSDIFKILRGKSGGFQKCNNVRFLHVWLYFCIKAGQHWHLARTFFNMHSFIWYRKPYFVTETIFGHIWMHAPLRLREKLQF